jgi:hypothetical protein
MGRKPSWTPAMEEYLRELQARRHSAAVIAKAINRRFGLRKSRDSIAGKCRRLQISLNGEPRPWGRTPSFTN